MIHKSLDFSDPPIIWAKVLFPWIFLTQSSKLFHRLYRLFLAPGPAVGLHFKSCHVSSAEGLEQWSSQTFWVSTRENGWWVCQYKKTQSCFSSWQREIIWVYCHAKWQNGECYVQTDSRIKTVSPKWTGVNLPHRKLGKISFLKNKRRECVIFCIHIKEGNRGITMWTALEGNC